MHLDQPTDVCRGYLTFISLLGVLPQYSFDFIIFKAMSINKNK